MNWKKIKRFILDIISFGSPLAIVINLSFIFLILFLIPTESVGSLPVRSVFKEFLLHFIFRGNCPESGFLKNCDVYSTGQTRGISRLLHGDFAGAYAFNKLVFLLFAVMISLIIINLVKIYKSNKK